MKQSGVVKSGALHELLDCMIRNGGVRDTCRPWMSITQNVFQESGEKIPLAFFTAIIENAANDSGNVALGLQLGREFRPAALGPLGRLMPTAGTFGDAAESFVRYFKTIQTNTKVGLSISDNHARISYRIDDPAVRFRSQDAAFTLSIEHSLFSSLLDAVWQPGWVEFAHEAPDDVSPYRRCFGCPVRFGQRENAFVFPARLLSMPLRHTDLKMYADLLSDLESSSIFEEGRLSFDQSVEAWIAAAICNGESTNIEFAANDFGMSLRSFHRKLIDYDVGYLDIKNRVRLKIAKSLLRGAAMSVTNIAMFLGYSESSAFVRQFKMQTGITPRKYRNYN